MRIKICAVNPDVPRGPWQIASTKDGSMLHNHPPDKSKRGRRPSDLSTSAVLPGHPSSEVSTGDEGLTTHREPLRTPMPQSEDVVSRILHTEPSVSQPACRGSSESVTPEDPVTAQPSQRRPAEHTIPSTRSMEGTLYAWPRRRPPHAFVMDFRERIFRLFGAQPVPLHVVESLAMKEMIYALRPTMVPYVPTLRETHEAITRRRYDLLGPVGHHNIQR